MQDAFGVDRDQVSKAWKGEPGDKRNSKYALAALAGAPVPVVGSLGTAIGYGIYRQSDRSKKERAASIKRAKKSLVKKSEDESSESKAHEMAEEKCDCKGCGGKHKKDCTCDKCYEAKKKG